MATIVMIYGQSGTGKSSSLRNFESGQVSVVNVSGKPMPFRKKLPSFRTDNYVKIMNAINNAQTKSIVIDDATYLMVDEFMRTAKQQGYQKFTDMAKNFFDLIETARNLSDDKIVYFMGHSETDANGNEKFKTIGRLLDEKVTLEGKFTIVLKTVVQDGKYLFQTHNNGQDTVKSPLGMFEEDYIENDLAAVDAVIREYYEIEESKA